MTLRPYPGFHVAADAGTATAVQDAIDAASADGGGEVIIGPGACSLASTVTLKSNVAVRLLPGTTVTWAGASGGTMFTSPTADPLQRAGVFGSGAVIDMGSAGYVFDLHSPQFCEIGNFEYRNGTTTTVILRLTSDATNLSGYNAKRNVASNTFGHFLVLGTCQNVWVLDGVQTGDSVTLNRFFGMNAYNVVGKAIRLVRWVDNNECFGMTRMRLTADNAKALVVNDDSDPSVDVGVYANTFYSLAPDTFSGNTGRIGIELNKSKRTVVFAYHNNPTAEGGAVVDNYSSSHFIQDVGRAGGTGARAYVKNWGLGADSADATGPRLQFFKERGSGGISSSDEMGALQWKYRNAALSEITSMELVGTQTNPTSPSDTAQLEFWAAHGGNALAQKGVWTSNGRLGLGAGAALTPGAMLHLLPIGTATPGIVIQAVASMTARLLELRTNGAGVLGGFDVNGHLALDGAGFVAPTIAAGAGGDATATVTVAASSTDQRGTISIVTAGTPSASAVVCTVTFNKAYSATPWVVICEGNANAANRAANGRLFIDRSLGDVTTGGFSLRVGTTALTAGLTFQYHYWVIG